MCYITNRSAFYVSRIYIFIIRTHLGNIRVQRKIWPTDTQTACIIILSRLIRSVHILYALYRLLSLSSVKTRFRFATHNVNHVLKTMFRTRIITRNAREHVLRIGICDSLLFVVNITNRIQPNRTPGARKDIFRRKIIVWLILVYFKCGHRVSFCFLKNLNSCTCVFLLSSRDSEWFFFFFKARIGSDEIFE